jgi:hypothetical protein
MALHADSALPVFTTSIGSLPRPEPMLVLLAARENGQPVEATSAPRS